MKDIKFKCSNTFFFNFTVLRARLKSNRQNRASCLKTGIYIGVYVYIRNALLYC